MYLDSRLLQFLIVIPWKQRYTAKIILYQSDLDTLCGLLFKHLKHTVPELSLLNKEELKEDE